MVIKDNQTLKEIQQAFSSLFPYLKVEFYRQKHGDFGGSHIKDQLHPDQLVKDIRTIHTEGDITIDPNMSVLVFEQLFEEKFGLNVQVFRKSGNIWIQTSVTDYLTLEMQNRKALQSEAI